MSCLAQLTRSVIARGDVMAKANTTTLLDLMTGDGRRQFRCLYPDRPGHAVCRGAERHDGRGNPGLLEPLVGMIAPWHRRSGGRERSHGFLYRQHVRLIEFRKSLHETRSMVREEAGESTISSTRSVTRSSPT